MSFALLHKRVRVLYVGGMHLSQGYTPEDAQAILNYFLDLQLVASFDIVMLDHVAGADVTWDLGIRIAEDIRDHYNDYEGFVVIHSVDNAAYTACFVQFLFTDLGKPIIFTGSAVRNEVMSLPDGTTPEPYHRLGLRSNLLTAIQLAVLNCSNVMLVYGPHLVRAVRAVEEVTETTKFFNSLESLPTISTEFGLDFNATVAPRHNRVPQLNTGYTPAVTVLDLRPGLVLPADLGKVIIVRGYHEQVFPKQLGLPNDRPIIVDSIIKNFALPANAWCMTGVTLPVLVTKAMVLAERTKSVTEFKKQFQKNWLGELPV